MNSKYIIGIVLALCLLVQGCAKPAPEDAMEPGEPMRLNRRRV